MKDFLKRLLNSFSPSSFEDEAVKIWVDYAKQFADKVWTDLYNNSFACINWDDSKFKIAMFGHIDEIGGIIHYIDDKGFLYFKKIGGLDLKTLHGQRVKIKSKDGSFIAGVIGKKPVHLERGEEKKEYKIEDFYIDIGLSSRKEVLEYIDIGAPWVIERDYKELQKDNFTARGIDDRIGAYIVIEVLKKVKGKVNYGVCAVASSEEEIGGRGARISSFEIYPNVAIVVDVIPATDTPDINVKKTGEIKVGKGPVISYGGYVNKKVADYLIKIAKEKGIPYQIDAVGSYTGTDADVVQVTKSGVPVGVVSVPTRYLHTPVELANFKDVENTIELISQFIKNVKTSDFERKINL
ncbi:M42 family peptidase [Candidatus Pacearchaeota archaeon]|nr:MAG: M42 family peptidase [Candidatus Pacearchaeota archaeon]